MTLFIIFTIGYVIGGVSALVLFSLMVAGRERATASSQRLASHDA